MTEWPCVRCHEPQLSLGRQEPPRDGLCAICRREIDAKPLRQILEEAGVPRGFLACTTRDAWRAQPDIGSIDAYLDIVAERSARRALIDLGGAAIQDSLTGPEDVANVLARLQMEIPTLLRSAVRTSLRAVSDIVPPVLAEIEEQPEILRGIPTGFHGLDRLTSSLRAEEIAALQASAITMDRGQVQVTIRRYNVTWKAVLPIDLGGRLLAWLTEARLWSEPQPVFVGSRGPLSPMAVHQVLYRYQPQKPQRRARP